MNVFEDVGTVHNVFLPLDRNTGRPRGFAFVEFESEEVAQEAVDKFDGHELDGRALRVNIAQDKPRREAPQRFSGGPSRGGPPPRPSRPKGSRKGSRGKKRSL